MNDPLLPNQNVQLPFIYINNLDLMFKNNLFNNIYITINFLR